VFIKRLLTARLVVVGHLLFNNPHSPVSRK
jgi:hypothetical protein